MRVVFYTNNISPHQLPLAREVMRRVGRENLLYVGERIAWRGKTIDAGEVRICAVGDLCAQDWLENADVMYTGGLRPIELMERRAKRGLKTLYYSERWFKPLGNVRLFGLFGCSIPGWARLLAPRYRQLAKRFAKLANENACVTFLPTGPWTKRDFLTIGVKNEKMADWGYFVSPSASKIPRKARKAEALSVLWVGREIGLKRVGDIEKAVASVARRSAVTFTKLTGGTLDEVREAMRHHDLYVLASDANEGWGAALNEALEEGMSAVGTFEAGSSAAMLPRERLYHAGDWKSLARLIERELRGELPPCSIGDWTAAKAAERLLAT